MSRAATAREARLFAQAERDVMGSVLDSLLSHETPAQAWLRQAGPYFARMNAEALAENEAARMAAAISQSDQKQQDCPRAAVDSLGAGHSEVEPDGRQDEADRGTDRQSGGSREVGGRTSVLTGSLQRSECNVRSQDRQQDVIAVAGENTFPATPSTAAAAKQEQVDADR